MNTQTYYVSWSTWKEEPVNTAWDFWFLSNGVRYKLRKGAVSKLRPTPDMLKEAFTSQEAAVLEELETNFIHDVKLIAFVPALDSPAAQAMITSVFEDAEFEKCVAVTSETQEEIISLINHTLHQSKEKGL